MGLGVETVKHIEQVRSVNERGDPCTHALVGTFPFFFSIYQVKGVVAKAANLDKKKKKSHKTASSQVVVYCICHI